MAEAPVTVAAAPDAGQLLRQTTPPPAVQAPSKPDIEGLPTSPTPRADGPAIEVKGWKISGNTVFSTEVLTALLADKVGQQLRLGDLDKAAATITAYYRNAGYPLAQAYLPRQKVTGGEVEIAILEGQVEAISPDKPSVGKLDPDLMKDYLDRVPTGQVAQDGPLNELAVLLNELPGMTSKLTLQPGQRPGGTEVLITLNEVETWKAGLDADNYGSYGTGRYRYGASGSYHNLAGRGDSIDLRAQRTSAGETNGSVDYSLVLSGAGDRLGASVSHLNYELSGIYSGLGRGTADTVGVNYRYPLLRTPTSAITAMGLGEYKRLKDESPALNNQRHDEALTFGLTGANADEWGGTSGYANLIGGRLGFDDSAAQTADQSATGARTQGDFAKLAYSASRVQRVVDGINLFGAVTGQHSANKRLDSAERLTLGGPDGVRAYPVGETTGDSGFITNAEVRYVPGFWGDLPGKPQVSLFYDYGHIYKNANVDLRTDTTTKQGWGFGAGYEIGPVTAKGSIAWRVSGLPAAQPAYGPSQIYFQLATAF